MSDMSRIMKVVSEQSKRSLPILLIGFFGTAWVIYPIMGFGFVSGLVHLVVTFIAVRVMAFISVVTLQRKYYNGDIQSFVSDVAKYDAQKRGGVLRQHESIDDESPQPASKTIEITVVDYPDSPSGSFKDHPIFEWLIIEIDGTRFKVAFEGILNVVEGQDLNLKKDQILIAPGILYSKVS